MFKVGDKVEVVDNAHGIGEIVKLHVEKETYAGKPSGAFHAVHFSNGTFAIAESDLKLITLKQSTFDDLKDGMIVKCRDGQERILYKSRFYNYEGYFTSLEDYDNNLIHYYNEKHLDIMQVKTLDSEVLWEREKKYEYAVHFKAQLEEGITKVKFETISELIDWLVGPPQDKQPHHEKITIYKVERVEVGNE